MQVSSTAFVSLGRAQARALGYADLPIAVIPHPFGTLSRAKVRELAEQCVDDIAKLISEATPPNNLINTNAKDTISSVEVRDDVDAVNRLFRDRRWSDGLPVVPPTVERVSRMLRHTHRNLADVVANLAPGFGAATVERIAVNAVMAGCDPEYLPVIIAAVEAMADSRFNLQGIQATTNPVAVWLIVNGPVVKRLNMNAGMNCLGQGNWANATLSRALRLIMQNVGRALPGEMDRATHGQPGKYIFCCAENEDQSPWEPLHVERGLKRSQSAVTVVGAEGTLNMNTHSKDADEMIRIFAETLPRPPSNDYCVGGEPWLIISPEHAAILKAGGFGKSDVKRRLWQESKMPAHRMAKIDMQRTQNARRTELGEIRPETLLPVSASHEDIGIIVAGGPGTHSIYIPSLGSSRATTREVIWSN